MSKHDKPLKQPYNIIAAKYCNIRGLVSIIYDQNSEEYYTGIGITIDNISTGGPYGVITSVDEQSAYDVLYRYLD